MKFTYLLSLLDRYPHRLEVKGGWRQCRSEVIIITSNKHPRNVYIKSDEEIQQLLRCIDIIYNFDNEGDRIIAHAQKLGNTIPTPELDLFELTALAEQVIF